MERTTIWSSDGGFTEILKASREDKVNYLRNLGYEGNAENLTDEELTDVLDTDSWQYEARAITDFDDRIAPVIESQCRDGLTIGINSNGLAVPFFVYGFTRELIYDYGDNGLIELVADADGTLEFKEGDFYTKLYAYPEDEEKFEALKSALLEADENSIIDDELYLENIDSDIIIKYCDPIKAMNLLDESLNINEAYLDEAKVDQSQATQLKDDIERIKGFLENHPFSDLTETQFTNFDNDETSIEYNFPQFARLVREFFKELDREEYEASDIDTLWDTNFFPEDLEAIFKVGEIISNKPGKNKQFKGFIKNNSTLDDDEILASREESLDEDLQLNEGDFSKKTNQGWLIVKKFKDLDDGRIHVIAKRESDDPNDYNFAIGLGYNENTGSWGQGMYDYKTAEEAENALKRNNRYGPYNVEPIEEDIESNLEEFPPNWPGGSNWKD
jgi:hypothetical protein